MTRDAGQQLVGKQGISQQVGTTLEESEMGMLSTGVGSATCVQHSIGSRNSAVRSAYRTSLRPSSLFEPRHPSLEVVRLGKIILYMGISCSRSYMSTRSKVWRRTRCNPTKHGSCVRTVPHTFACTKCVDAACNDPSAGSPTETLLRLLLPLSGLVY